MAKGTVPVADILDILDSFPLPDSRYEQWYHGKQELVQEATGWYRKQQVVATGPIPLHGEALLGYFFTLLEAEFEPDQQLLAYYALQQSGVLPLSYLADVRLLEPLIIDSYPK